MNHRPPYRWQPISDLPENWKAFASTELPSLMTVWKEQAQQLQQSETFQIFMERMRREIAIETGVIERLYTLSRGITQLLIEEGIDAALIPHGETDRPASEVVAMIRDHEQALEGLFKFVNQKRELSTSYIKELHSFLTQHQDYTEAIDQFGSQFRVPLERGAWKKHPNNPLRPDNEIHEYAPPEHVASEMDNLISWHLEHCQADVPPEVEAAWLHHRFTQIHPFQDGNDRVARCLATLIFIREGYFPLTLTRDDRVNYIEALEQADDGHLRPLVELFTKRQRQAFVRALGLSSQVMREGAPIPAIIASVADTLKTRRSQQITEARKQVEAYTTRLFGIACERLRELDDEIKRGLAAAIKYPEAYTNCKEDKPDGRHYNRYQIFETARQLDYYANLVEYNSSVVLTIKLNQNDDESFVEILVAFHALGRDYLGIMAASACAYWKDPAEDGTKLIRNITPLSDAPFQVSYADDYANVEPRFNTWLEDVIVSGLSYWGKGI